MVMSKSTTVAQYLRELAPERRAEIEKVHAVVTRHMPKGYVERMNWGMIVWEIPLTDYPNTYNGQPLCYAGLAAQKHYNSLYLTGAYSNPASAISLEQAFKDAGKKFDMGKSCLRFKRADDLALDAIGALIASIPPKDVIARYDASRTAPSSRTTTSSQRGKKTKKTKKVSSSQKPSRARNATSSRPPSGAQRTASSRKPSGTGWRRTAGTTRRATSSRKTTAARSASPPRKASSAHKAAGARQRPAVASRTSSANRRTPKRRNA